MSNSSIWPIGKTLSGATTLGQIEPGSNGNEEVHYIPQSSSITGVSLSDCLVSYPGHLLKEFYLSTELQLVYFTAPANCTTVLFDPRTTTPSHSGPLQICSQYILQPQPTGLSEPRTLLFLGCLTPQ